MKKERIMGTKKWLYWVSIGTILIIIYKFFDNFSGIGKWLGTLFGILAPFLAAIIIAYVLYTPCSKIEKLLKKNKKIKHTRGISIICVYLIVAISIFLILKFIIPAVINSIVDLVNNVQNYYNAITTNEIEANWAPFIKDNILKPVVEYIQSIDFQSMFTPEKIKDYLISVFGAVKGVLNIFIAIICSIYILAEKEQILRFIDNLAKATMSKNGYDRFDRYFTNGNKIFFKFISSQFIDGCVVAIMLAIAITIMKVKYGVALGIMVGLFNLIPYFGAIVGISIAAIITILTGGWKQAIIMTIVMIILQQIDANIINPRITGSRLNVSPLLVIFSVTIGGAYWGVFGMFIAVPIAVLIKLMIEDFVNNKKQKQENIEE